MAKQTQAPTFTPPFADFPAGYQAFWNPKNPALNSGTLNYAEWVKDFTRLQEESLRFMRERFAEQFQTASALAACKTPAEALDLQMKFANATMAEYMAEGKKLMALYGLPAKAEMAKRQ